MLKKYKTELYGLEYIIRAKTPLNAAKQTLAKFKMYSQLYTINGKHFRFMDTVGCRKVEESVTVEELP